LALAILCSLLLTGAPLFAAQSPVPACCAKHVRPCCQHGVMPCCAAKSTPDSQPAPARTTNGGQLQVPLLTLAALIWTMPSDPAISAASTSAPLPSTSAAPLFARNCAWLI
jgi:hypothetical protein